MFENIKKKGGVIVITFDDFKNSNARPGLTEVDLSTIQYKTLSEIQQMSFTDVMKLKPFVICDNPLWLAKSTSAGGRESYYSYDGKYIWSIPKTLKRVTRQILEGKKLIIVDHTDLKYSETDSNLKEHKEELSMNENGISLEDMMNEINGNTSGSENNEGIAADSGAVNVAVESNSLDSIMQQAAQELNSGTVPEMNAFSGDSSNEKSTSEKSSAITDEEKAALKAKKQAEKERMASVIKAIKNEATNVAPDIDLTLLSKKWEESARLICFVTPTDKRQAIVASKVAIKKQDKELIDNVPDEILQLKLSGRVSEISNEYFKDVFAINAKEGKPGKACGVIARIPAFLKGCSLMDFTKSVALEGAKTADNATVIEIFTMTDFEQKLTLVGGKISEDPETALEDGKAGVIELVATYPRDTSASTDGTLINQGFVFSKKLVRVGNGNRTPLHDRNYFPLTTYETVNILDAIPEDKLAALNDYTFESLFGTKKNDKQTNSKYEYLKDEDKVHIRKDTDGHITSDYITNDAARRVQTLKATAFYDKNVARPSLNIALKARTTKADGTLGTPQFIKYTVTAEDKMKDSDYFAKSSLGNGQFSHIVDLVGEELLNPTSLKEIFKRGSTSTATSKKLSSATVRDLTLAKLYGGLTGYDIAGFTFD